MKRSRPDFVVGGGDNNNDKGGNVDDNLGALEFAAALNGDDPHKILDCLKRFVKIVRSERRRALSSSYAQQQQQQQISDEDEEKNHGEEEEEEYTIMNDDDDDDDGSDQSDDTDNDDKLKKKKKFKSSESWKEDTRSYNVPFVGTSVTSSSSSKGVNRVVVKGQWPTGLLKEYLERSSLAVELTGESLFPPSGYIHKFLLRIKHGKMSQLIFKTYLNALAELITAVIPKATLKRELLLGWAHPIQEEEEEDEDGDKSSNQNQRFLEVILKERVPTLLNLLVQETKTKNRGGTGGFCGPMVPFVLNVLSRIIQTNVQNARNLIRTIEQNIPEGVWRCVIRLPPLHKHKRQQQQQQQVVLAEEQPKQQQQQQGEEEEEEEEANSTSKQQQQTPAAIIIKKDIRRERARTSFLHLVRCLLNTKDSTVFYYSSNPGSKDRKISSGLFVLALREALKDTTTLTFQEEDEDNEEDAGTTTTIGKNIKSSSTTTTTISLTRKFYYQEMTQFLRSIRDILWNSPGLLSQRRWNDLLSTGDNVLLNLCELSLCAPALTTATKPDQEYQKVLHGTDDSSAATTTTTISSSKRELQQRVGLEARRLLWSLLVDPERSPLLQSLGGGRGQQHNNNHPNSSAHHHRHSTENIIVRTMCRLLDTKAQAGTGSSKLALQHCLFHGIQMTPTLLPSLFRQLAVPDSTKQPYSFLARMRFISMLIRQGPEPSQCLLANNNNNNNKSKSKTDDSFMIATCIRDGNIDALHPLILPLGLKKSNFSKAIQSKNAIIVSEALKCLHCILQRLDTIRRLAGRITAATSEDDIDAAAKDCWEMLSVRITGQIPDIQVILSTFSRFDLQGEEKAAPIVCGHLALVLLTFGLVLPEVLQGVKFDWIKILPNEAETFCRLPLMLQLRLLRTLESILKPTNTTSSMSSASCKILLEIMASCRAPLVYDAARKICCMVIRQLVPVSSPEGEIRQCLDHEIFCWLDCMVPETIQDFCTLIEEASQLSFQSEIRLFQAWNAAGLPKPIPKLPSSPILIAAISTLSTGSFPRRMASMVCQVLAKCLLYHHNPLPLATIVTFLIDSSKSEESTKAGEDDKVEDAKKATFEYARSLVQFQAVSNSKRAKLLRDLVEAHFPLESFHHKVLHFLLDENTKLAPTESQCSISNMDSVAAIRQLSHMLACTNNGIVQQNSLALLQNLLPLALQAPSDNNHDVLLDNILGRLEMCNVTELKYLELCAVSQSPKQFANLVIGRILARIEEDQSAKKSRGDINLLFLVRPFLSQRSLALTTSKLLSMCCAGDKDDAHFHFLAKITTSYVTEVLERPTHEIVWTSAQSINAFRAWQSITEVFSRSDPAAVLITLSLRLENLLCRMLAYPSEISSTLYLSNYEQAPEDLLSVIVQNRCLTGLVSKDDCLLVKLLDCDPHRFTLTLVRHLFGMASSTSIQKSWHAGSFDEAILCVVKRMEVLRTFETDRQNLVAAILDRSHVSLKKAFKARDSTKLGKILQILQEVNAELLEGQEGTTKLSNEMTLCLGNDQFQEVIFGHWDAPSRVGLLQSAVTLREFLKESDEKQDALLTQKLGTLLFVRLSQQLPRVLRKTRKAEQEHHSSDKITDPSLLISWLLPMTVDFATFDMDTLASIDPTCTSSLLRGCLKYGMADSDSVSFVATSTGCLQLARRLVALLSSSNTPSLSENLHSPSDVYEMIVSHSKFKVALSGPRIDQAKAARKLELVRLLLTCISLANTNNPIEFEKEVWDVLFTAYNAGVGITDSSLRRLLYVATKRQHNSASLPFLDQFRWHGVLDPSEEKSQPVWDWLLNGLSMARIHQTLQGFPLDDQLEPPPLADVEVWLEVKTNNAIDEAIVNDKDTSDSQSASRSASGSDETKSNTFPTHDDDGGTEKKLDLTEEVKDVDLSYSPAYVLPLILAALESCIQDEAQTDDQAKEKKAKGRDGTNKRLELLAKTAHRLCEKGALCLAIASLCSRCCSIRQIAVGVIGLMTQALDSDEALQIAAWRERPQLGMLLHSVHRALAIRRATLLSKASKDKDSPSVDPWMVPILPGFSAIFLARTALALSRPGDSMFTPLNRFFLSINDDHGAFNDLNRLPGFITFLCSASDEPAGQSRNERIWALRLFRDGFLSDHSFKMASDCHAPELLLTTFFNYRMRTGSGNMIQQEEECVLLLEAIETMVQSGGRHGANHVFTRMGMLSWLFSVLVNRALNLMLPTRACRVAFLKLLSTCVGHATTQELENKEAADDLTFEKEILSLAQPTLRLCVAALKDTESPPDNVSNDALVTASVGALESLFSALLATSFNKWASPSDGVSFQLALDFLSVTSKTTSPQTRDAWDALACFPVQTSANVEESVEFCGRALKFLASPDLSHRQVLRVVRRVSLILEDLLSTVKDTATRDGVRAKLLPRLLENRNNCFQSQDCRSLWFVCLRHLMEADSMVVGDNGEEHKGTVLWFLAQVRLP